MSMAKRFWKPLLVQAAFARDFPFAEEAPNDFVSVEVVAGFANLLFGGVLLAAGPRVAPALDAVQNDLCVVVAGSVGERFGFFAALL